MIEPLIFIFIYCIQLTPNSKLINLILSKFFFHIFIARFEITKDTLPNEIWQEYYESPSENYTIITNNTSPIISMNLYFLLLSNFKDFNNHVINCNVDSLKLIHSVCTYTNIIRTEGDGGCVYFEGSSSIVQDRFCAIKCYTPNRGKYSYVNVKTETNKNLVNFGSFYQCGNDSTGSSCIYHHHGVQTLISSNITNTKSRRDPAYSFLYSPVLINLCCFISNDNQESDYMCMNHFATPDSFVKNSLIKNNTCKNDSQFYGLLYCQEGIITVSECIFFQNQASFIFSAVQGGIMTIIHCFGDVLTAACTADGSITSNEISTDAFDLKLSLFSLGKCEAEFPIQFRLIFVRNKCEKTLLIDRPILLDFSFNYLVSLKNN